jgi:hypothetical protein
LDLEVKSFANYDNHYLPNNPDDNAQKGVTR